MPDRVDSSTLARLRETIKDWVPSGYCPDALALVDDVAERVEALEAALDKIAKTKPGTRDAGELRRFAREALGRVSQ